MRKVYVSNAFSLSMLDIDSEGIMPTSVEVAKVSAATVAEAFKNGAKSCVGHADTAKLFSGILETEVSMNRESIKLGLHDVLYVGQYTGPRLPEGSTTLPEGAAINWIVVHVVRRWYNP